MRHGNKVKKLGKTSSHRKAMMANMASSLIKSPNKRIETTLAKAKALREYVEPLFTRSKLDNTHNRRQAFRYLQDKVAAQTLFDEVAQKVAERTGGYTRIIKLGRRLGDGAETALIELVDYNTMLLDDDKPKRTRRRRKKKSSDSDQEVSTVEATPSETPGADVETEATAATEAVAEVQEAVEAQAEVVEDTAEDVAETAETTVEDVAEIAETSVEVVEEESPEAPETVAEATVETDEPAADEAGEAKEEGTDEEDQEKKGE